MDLNTICGAVGEAFSRSDAATPSWPDPHPEGQPAGEEYSRCLDPAKYRIVGARGEAWVRALRFLELASVVELDEMGSAWRDDAAHGVTMTRARRLLPYQPDAVPLLVCFTSFDAVPDNGVVLGAGTPAVELAPVPVCGCDACDSGSANLLEELDAQVLDVISGAFVHVTTPDGVARSGRGGWSASAACRGG